MAAPFQCNGCNGWPVYYNTFGKQQETSDFAAINASTQYQGVSNFIVEVEPAYFTPRKQVLVIPYYNNTIAAAAPVLAQTNTSTLAPVQVVEGSPLPPFNATACGCCQNVYSPLTQHSAYALRDVIMRNQAPIEDAIGSGCSMRR